jgi:hypothetical protein
MSYRDIKAVQKYPKKLRDIRESESKKANWLAQNPHWPNANQPDEPKINLAAFTILLNMAIHTNDDHGYCWLLADTLADESNITKRQCYRAIKELEEKRIICVNRRWAQSSQFIILFNKSPEDIKEIKEKIGITDTVSPDCEKSNYDTVSVNSDTVSLSSDTVSVNSDTVSPIKQPNTNRISPNGAAGAAKSGAVDVLPSQTEDSRLSGGGDPQHPTAPQGTGYDWQWLENDTLIRAAIALEKCGVSPPGNRKSRLEWASELANHVTEYSPSRLPRLYERTAKLMSDTGNSPRSPMHMTIWLDSVDKAMRREEKQPGYFD